MNTYDVILSKIHELGYVPSLRAMTQILKKDGFPITASAVRYWYNILCEDGILADTNSNPKWVLKFCIECGEQLVAESYHEHCKVDEY